MMQLSLEEAICSRSQNATLKKRGQNIKYLPYVFTEHGVVMLSAVLSSEVAVNMSIDIVRAFVRLRELLATDQEFAFRLEQLEASVDRHTSVINILAEDISHLQTLPAAISQSALPDSARHHALCGVGRAVLRLRAGWF